MMPREMRVDNLILRRDGRGLEIFATDSDFPQRLQAAVRQAVADRPEPWWR
jgi:hypothetical protein